MDFEARYPIARSLLPVPSNRRCGWRLTQGVRFIVAHDTGNPGATARQTVDYFRRTAHEPVSVHVLVDDRDIIECIPAFDAPEKAWHVRHVVETDDHMLGYDANDAALGIEYCYGGAIDADQAYARYVWVIAYCCHIFGLDPAAAVIGHFMLDPERQADPATGLASSRRTYEQLLRDVAAVYRECRGQPAPAPLLEVASGQVRTKCSLVVRAAPHRRAPVARTVAPRTTLAITAIVREGEPINGNPVWYRDADGNYFWSGGTDQSARSERMSHAETGQAR